MSDSLKRLKAVAPKLGSSDYAKQQVAYMRGVLDGSIVAGELIKLSMERAIRDHEKPPTGTSEQKYQFSPERADRACRFFATLPAPGGHGKMILGGWMCFALRELMGWVYYSERVDAYVRRFQYALISMGRKNGKSAFAAAVALYGWLAEPLDLECKVRPGSNSVYFSASQYKQAKIAFNLALEMFKRGGLSIFGAKAHTNSMKLTGDMVGECEAVAKDQGGSLDGKNPGVAIIDELHSHPNHDVMNAMVLGQANRPQPLLFIISTAGKDQIGSPLKVEWDAMALILKDEVKAEDKFGLIFTADEGDDWMDEAQWPKSLPSISDGIADIAFIRGQSETAKLVTSHIFEFEVKLLNRWATQTSGFFPMKQLDECGAIKPRFSFNDLQPNKNTYIGVDLGDTRDLTAITALQIEKDGDAIIKVEAATTCFVPHSHLDRANGVEGRFYREMRETRTADLEFTPGMSADHQRIREFLFGLVSGEAGLRVVGVGGDNFQSAGIMDDLDARFPNLEIVKQKPSASVMSEPLQVLELLILGKKFVWSGSAFLRWQYANMIAEQKETAASKVLTISRPSRKAKIDAPISVLNALSVAINHSRSESSGGFFDTAEWLTEDGK